MRASLVTLAAIPLVISAFYLGRWSRGPGDALSSAHAHSQGHTFRPQASSSLPLPPPPATDGAPLPFDQALIYIINEDNQAGFAYDAGLYRILEAMSEDDLQRALLALATVVEADQTRASRMVPLLKRWADYNPQAALAYVESLNLQQKSWLNQTVVLSWANRDPRAALAYIETISDDQERRTQLSMYIQGIASRDVGAALQLIEAMPIPTEHERHTWVHTYASVLRELARTDRQAALDRLRQMDNPAARQQVARGFIHGISQQDPELAMQIAVEFEDSNSNLSTSVISNWANRDKTAAMNYIMGVSNEDRRQRLLASYLAQAGNKNPMESMAMINQHLSGNAREGAIRNILQTWAHKDIEATLSFIESMPTGSERERAIRDIGWQISQHNPERAFAWFQQNLSGQQLANSIGNAIGQMAKNDPAHTAQLIETLPYGRSYNSAVATLAREWGQTDPNRALQWINGLPVGPDRDSAFRSYASAVARLDSNQAYLIATSMPAGEERNTLITQVARAKAENNPVETAQWVITFPEDNLRHNAIREVVSTWGSREPQAVATFLATAPEGSLPANIWSRFASNWAGNDPAAAAAWTLTVPADQQASSVSQVSRSWLEHDLDGATQWIAGLPQGNPRQEAVNQLVDRVWRIDPEAAFEWSMELQDEQRRSRQNTRIVNEWIKRGETTLARRQIENSRLSPTEKETLIKRLEQ